MLFNYTPLSYEEELLKVYKDNSSISSPLMNNRKCNYTLIKRLFFVYAKHHLDVISFFPNVNIPYYDSKNIQKDLDSISNNGYDLFHSLHNLNLKYHYLFNKELEAYSLRQKEMINSDLEGYCYVYSFVYLFICSYIYYFFFPTK